MYWGVVADIRVVNLFPGWRGRELGIRVVSVRLVVLRKTIVVVGEVSCVLRLQQHRRCPQQNQTLQTLFHLYFNIY